MTGSDVGPAGTDDAETARAAATRSSTVTASATTTASTTATAGTSYMDVAPGITPTTEEPNDG